MLTSVSLPAAAGVLALAAGMQGFLAVKQHLTQQSLHSQCHWEERDQSLVTEMEATRVKSALVAIVGIAGRVEHYDEWDYICLMVSQQKI